MDKIKSPPYVVRRARELRRNQTPAERILWACLRGGSLNGAKFRRQHPLGRYIADFYCHEAGLIVELEGDVHRQPDQRQYDAVRRLAIEQLGVKVLSFKNLDVMEDVQGVLAKIAEAVDDPHPRPLSLRERGGQGPG